MQEQQSNAQLRLASQAFGTETAILAKKLAAALATLAETQKSLSSLQVTFVHLHESRKIELLRSAEGGLDLACNRQGSG